jgi:two-component system NarL family response regulator
VIRVVIADDHPLFREGLRRALSLMRDFALAGEASDGQEALQVCQREEPDVLLVDLTMPRCDGFAVLEQLSRVSPDTRAIVLTAHPIRGFEERSLAAGAAGFLPKDSSVETIEKAIRAVMAGEVWATRVGACNVLADSSDSRGPLSLLSSLTSREEEILSLLAQGLRNAEIARRTHISERTIGTHVTNLTQKLGVRSRVEAALLWRRYSGSRAERGGSSA